MGQPLKVLAAKTDNLSWGPGNFNGVRRDPNSHQLPSTHLSWYRGPHPLVLKQIWKGII